MKVLTIIPTQQMKNSDVLQINCPPISERSDYITVEGKFYDEIDQEMFIMGSNDGINWRVISAMFHPFPYSQFIKLESKTYYLGVQAQEGSGEVGNLHALV